MARAVAVLAALGAFAGALVAVLAGWTVDWLACENQGTPACARQNLATAVYHLAIAGLAPTAVLLVAAVLGKHRLALVALAVCVPLYIVWALLLDAAVHGWDDLTLIW